MQILNQIKEMEEKLKQEIDDINNDLLQNLRYEDGRVIVNSRGISRNRILSILRMRIGDRLDLPLTIKEDGEVINNYRIEGNISVIRNFLEKNRERIEAVRKAERSMHFNRNFFLDHVYNKKMGIIEDLIIIHNDGTIENIKPDILKVISGDMELKLAKTKEMLFEENAKNLFQLTIRVTGRFIAIEGLNKGKAKTIRWFSIKTWKHVVHAGMFVGGSISSGALPHVLGFFISGFLGHGPAHAPKRKADFLDPDIIGIITATGYFSYATYNFEDKELRVFMPSIGYTLNTGQITNIQGVHKKTEFLLKSFHETREMLMRRAE